MPGTPFRCLSGAPEIDPVRLFPQSGWLSVMLNQIELAESVIPGLTRNPLG